MGSLESLKKQARTFREIQMWIFEVPLECRDYDAPIHQERLKIKWIPESVALKQIADLKLQHEAKRSLLKDTRKDLEKTKKQEDLTREELRFYIQKTTKLEGRLSAIQKLCNRLKQKYRGYEYAQVRIAVDEVLAVLLKEGKPQ